jgi:transposase
MKTFFVGIDISKDWLDVAICDETTLEISSSWKCNNTVEGIEKMIKKCLKQTAGSRIWYCFEHTGNYGLLLSSLLEASGASYTAVPALEIRRSIGMTRGKNDQVDAVRIATYAATHKLKLKASQLPGKQILRVKYLLTHRSLLLKTCVQLQNSRKSFLVASKMVELKDVIADLEKRIADLKVQVAAIEEAIKTELEKDDSLAKTFKKITSVKGVGLMIAATMIVCTNNFTAFENPRAFNCYAGLAPFSFSSGSSILGKTKTSKLRNRTMKTLLFNGANTAVMHDLDLKSYYNRKLKEGKHRMVVINSVACKMVYRIFAVLKREEPYINLTR